MACRTLLRRKTQLDLLRAACENGRRAHLSLRGRRTVSKKTAMVTLEHDGLVLAWDDDRIVEAEIAGQPLEVAFEHEGEHFVFRAVSRGATESRDLGDGEAACLKLSLPLRVERARRRRHMRWECPAETPLECFFIHVVDERRQFKARLGDLGDGGVGVIAQTTEVSQLYTGDLYWVTLELPGEKTRFELAVRLIHLRPVRQTHQIAMGWAFQPADDLALYQRYLRRLESLINRGSKPESITG